MPWNFDPTKRLWSRVNRLSPDECWEWTGAKSRAGYGVLTIQYVSHLAHRLAWELANGAIPDGLHVCHACDNPACCNPAHLFLGTPSDNIGDASQKGRIMHGESHIRAELTEIDVIEIRHLALTDLPRYEIAERFGVSRQTIGDVIARRTWKNIGDDFPIPNDRSHGINHPMAKLSPADVRTIRAMSLHGDSQRVIAKEFGVSHATIQAILNGKTWKHV